MWHDPAFLAPLYACGAMAVDFEAPVAELCRQNPFVQAHRHAPAAHLRARPRLRDAPALHALRQAMARGHGGQRARAPGHEALLQGPRLQLVKAEVLRLLPGARFIIKMINVINFINTT